MPEDVALPEDTSWLEAECSLLPNGSRGKLARFCEVLEAEEEAEE